VGHIKCWPWDETQYADPGESKTHNKSNWWSLSLSVHGLW